MLRHIIVSVALFAPLSRQGLGTNIEGPLDSRAKALPAKRSEKRTRMAKARGREWLKRPSHGKLKLANSCWQSQVGACERRKNGRQTRWQTVGDKKNVFADCFCAVHTHQLEFANTSLPTLVCRLKAA